MKGLNKMKGIYTDKDLCPVCKKRHITYQNMEITNDGIKVCGNECKEKHNKLIKFVWCDNCGLGFEAFNSNGEKINPKRCVECGAGEDCLHREVIR